MNTLRHLLVQRAARLQDRPALSCKAWGTLDYSQLRNRVEGVALGLMADAPPPETLYYVPSSDSGSPDGPWSWIAEVAVIACGFVWSPQGNPIDSSVLGGPRFNDEEGRGPFHDRDHQIAGSCLAVSGLSHKDILLRLQRENEKRGWDHTTKLSLSCSDATTASGRALLWNALYAGSHVILTEPELPSRFQTFFSKNKPIPASLDNWGDFWIPNQDLG